MKIETIILEEILLPSYATAGAAGADLKANRVKNRYKYGIEGLSDPSDKVFVIQPFERVLFGTGVTMAVPEGYEAQVRPRGGTSLKTNLVVVLGTVDSDYRGEIGIIAYNAGPVAITVKKNERIAQLVISKVEKATFTCDTLFLPETKRGDGAYGHTGK